MDGGTKKIHFSQPVSSRRFRLLGVLVCVFTGGRASLGGRFLIATFARAFLRRIREGLTVSPPFLHMEKTASPSVCRRDIRQQDSKLGKVRARNRQATDCFTGCRPSERGDWASLGGHTACRMSDNRDAAGDGNL